jgi:hypothetical protein
VDPDVKRLFDEFKLFNDGLLARFDLSMRRIDRRMDAQAAEMREQGAAMRELGAEMREQGAAMREMRHAIAMNTQGLLRVFERLDAAEGGA